MVTLADMETQTHISDIVRAWMKANGYVQEDLGKILGCGQTSAGRRLRGLTRWDTKDIDVLRAAGCPVHLPLIVSVAS